LRYDDTMLYVVQLCLEELGYDVEKVINALLEDRLSPSLRRADRTMPRYKIMFTQTYSALKLHTLVKLKYLRISQVGAIGACQGKFHIKN